MSLALSHAEDTVSTVLLSRARYGGLIGPARGQQGPEDPRLLGRQGDHRFIEPASGLKRRDPAAGGIRATGDLPHHRSGPMNEQGTYVHIAPLGDPPQAPGAATGMLPRDQAQPGRQLPPVPEGVGIAAQG